MVRVSVPSLPEVTAVKSGEPPVELGVRGFRDWLFWLLEGQGDGRVEELERSALGVGGLGEDGDGGLGAGEADLVAGQGAQMVEQSLVAVGAQVGVGGGFSRCFGVGVGGSAGGCDRVVAFGWVFVGEGQRGQRFTQVPGQVGGEHADQDVGADAVLEAVIDRAQVQVVGVDAAEVAFHAGQVFVGADHGGGVQIGGGHAGA